MLRPHNNVEIAAFGSMLLRAHGAHMPVNIIQMTRIYGDEFFHMAFYFRDVVRVPLMPKALTQLLGRVSATEFDGPDIRESSLGLLYCRLDTSWKGNCCTLFAYIVDVPYI